MAVRLFLTVVTENAKNMQGHSEACQFQTQLKPQNPKVDQQIAFLQNAANSTKGQIDKWGAGGGRAAWRIQIRTWPQARERVYVRVRVNCLKIPFCNPRANYNKNQCLEIKLTSFKHIIMRMVNDCDSAGVPP